MSTPTDKYKYCNHFHELTNDHAIVRIGGVEFVANKQAIPLLQALNDVGLKTRSHHIDDGPNAFICIMLDNVEIEVNKVLEVHADRSFYNGKKQLIIRWDK